MKQVKVMINFASIVLIIASSLIQNKSLCRSRQTNDRVPIDSKCDTNLIIVDTISDLSIVSHLFESSCSSHVDTNSKLLVVVVPLYSPGFAVDGASPTKFFIVNPLSDSKKDLSITPICETHDTATFIAKDVSYQNLLTFIKINNQKSYTRQGPSFNSICLLLNENGRKYYVCLDGFVEWDLSLSDICKKMQSSGLADKGLCELIGLTRALFD